MGNCDLYGSDKWLTEAFYRVFYQFINKDILRLCRRVLTKLNKVQLMPLYFCFWYLRALMNIISIKLIIT